MRRSKITPEIPRRSQMMEWTPEERAIHDVHVLVEAMGAHPRLTDAVILLGQARDAVADFVDQQLTHVVEVQPDDIGHLNPAWRWVCSCGEAGQWFHEKTDAIDDGNEHVAT